MIEYFKHYFDSYRIFKINDRYAVKWYWFCWIDSDGETTWWDNEFLTRYCLVNSCEEARNLIKRRKEYLRSIRPKVRFAKGCYK